MAVTNLYCTPGAAGGGGGGSFGDPYTLTELAANMGGTGYKVGHIGGGTYNETVTTNPLSDTTGVGRVLIGYKGDNSGPMVDWDDCPVIDYTGGGNGFGNGTQDRYTVYGIKTQNGAGDGIFFDDQNKLIKCWSTGHVGRGARIDLLSQTLLCRFTDNTGGGLQQSNGGIIGNEIYDNGGYGITSGNQPIVAAFNYIKNNGTGVSEDAQINNAGLNQMYAFNTIYGVNGDAGDEGIQLSNANELTLIAYNIITNCYDGVQTTNANSFLHLLAQNNFYGNTNDTVIAGELGGNILATALDPNFVNIGINDYEVQEAQLLSFLSLLRLGFNIGAWQGAASIISQTNRIPRTLNHGV